MVAKDDFENSLYKELEAAKEALFSCRSLREAKFWQEKIKYLQRLLEQKDLNSKNKKKRMKSGLQTHL